MSKIITAGNPLLKETAQPVTVFDKNLKFLLENMKKTLYEANGVGLAAPQIAVSKRIFVADDGVSGYDEYINPVWTPVGDEKDIDVEGCLSVPDLYGEVERYNIRTAMVKRDKKRHPACWPGAFSTKQII